MSRSSQPKRRTSGTPAAKRSSKPQRSDVVVASVQSGTPAAPRTIRYQGALYRCHDEPDGTDAASGSPDSKQQPMVLTPRQRQHLIEALQQPYGPDVSIEPDERSGTVLLGSHDAVVQWAESLWRQGWGQAAPRLNRRPPDQDPEARWFREADDTGEPYRYCVVCRTVRELLGALRTMRAIHGKLVQACCCTEPIVWDLVRQQLQQDHYHGADVTSIYDGKSLGVHEYDFNVVHEQEVLVGLDPKAANFKLHVSRYTRALIEHVLDRVDQPVHYCPGILLPDGMVETAGPDGSVVVAPTNWSAETLEQLYCSIRPNGRFRAPRSFVVQGQMLDRWFYRFKRRGYGYQDGDEAADTAEYEIIRSLADGENFTSTYDFMSVIQTTAQLAARNKQYSQPLTLHDYQSLDTVQRQIARRFRSALPKQHVAHQALSVLSLGYRDTYDRHGRSHDDLMEQLLAGGYKIASANQALTSLVDLGVLAIDVQPTRWRNPKTGQFIEEMAYRLAPRYSYLFSGRGDQDEEVRPRARKRTKKVINKRSVAKPSSNERTATVSIERDEDETAPETVPSGIFTVTEQSSEEFDVPDTIIIETEQD